MLLCLVLVYSHPHSPHHHPLISPSTSNYALSFLILHCLLALYPSIASSSTCTLSIVPKRITLNPASCPSYELWKPLVTFTEHLVLLWHLVWVPCFKWPVANGCSSALDGPSQCSIVKLSTRHNFSTLPPLPLSASSLGPSACALSPETRGIVAI